jgi:hypothetical protein
VPFDRSGPANSGFRRDERDHGFDHGGRPTDAPFDRNGPANGFRQDDRGRGFEQTRRPNEIPFDRTGPPNGFGHDERGRDFDQPRRPYEAPFDRNGPLSGFRHEDRGRNFDQPGWLNGPSGEPSRHRDEYHERGPIDHFGGPVGHYGPTTDRPMNDGHPRGDRGGPPNRAQSGGGYPDHGDFQRSGGTDDRFLNDQPGRNAGPRGSQHHHDNDRRFNEGPSPRREFESREYQQDNERKRPFNEAPPSHRESESRGYPPQGNPNEAERRSSTNSRGYALDPQPQRRRLS